MCLSPCMLCAAFSALVSVSRVRTHQVASRAFAHMAMSKVSPNKSMNRIREKNMKWLTERLENDLELQVLTVSSVEDTLAEREGGGEKQCKRKKKTSDGNDEKIFRDDEPGFIIDPSVHLPRQAVKYAAWKKGLLSELFCYCEPMVWSAARKKVDSHIMLKQILEFCFEIRCMSDATSDKVSLKGKLQVFEALRILHKSLGRRLSQVYMLNGFVDWSSEGFFSVEVVLRSPNSKREIFMVDKLHNAKRVQIPNELMPDKKIEITDKSIGSNCSWPDAFMYIDTAKQSVLVLSTLFPKVQRALTRNLSDELGATRRSPMALEDGDMESEVDSEDNEGEESDGASEGGPRHGASGGASAPTKAGASSSATPAPKAAGKTKGRRTAPASLTKKETSKPKAEAKKGGKNASVKRALAEEVPSPPGDDAAQALGSAAKGR